jgi:hypothetical protein
MRAYHTLRRLFIAGWPDAGDWAWKAMLDDDVVKCLTLRKVLD